MSGSSRFDRLEGEIVAGLRRAPGATPSSELDARILARAHAAVAKPKPRVQPRWFSLAAGLVVLVGTGLALRISQQVERAPSALDAPAPAAMTTEAAAPAPPATAAPAPVDIGDAAAAAKPVASTPAFEPAAAAATAARAEARQQAANSERQLADSESKDMSPPAKPAEELRRAASEPVPEMPATQGIATADERRDDFLTPSQPTLAQPRPFPAEPEPVVVAAPEAVSSAPPAAFDSAVSASAPAPPMPAAPAAAAVSGGALDTQADSAAKATGADAPASSVSASDAPARERERIEVTGATMPKPEAESLSKREGAGQTIQQAESSGEDRASDPYTDGIAAVRRAIASGDRSRARQLLERLQRDFPQRELPQDLREFADHAK